ncbi:MAG: conjugative transposon protein TraM [Cyclobacteriaceae bacterium]|nr:conjugative transposon protein TraM [Cyclobacteriaceae bacterium]
MKPHSQKFLQQRRFYMVLPLLVTPFITMIFWALGGGQGTPVQAQEVKSGLNTELPGAHFDKEDELWDKFALYEQAKRDSIKYEEARRNDPYYVVATLTGKNSPDTIPKEESKLNTSLGSKNKYAQMDQNEAMINQKLEQLTRQLNQTDQPVKAVQKSPIKEDDVTASGNGMTEDVDRLEKMMQIMAGSDTNDPEMQQIESMLDKILDVQHPERVREKIREQSAQHKQQVFPVEAAITGDNISLVEGIAPRVIMTNVDSTSDAIYIPQSSSNGFYGLDDDVQSEDENSNAIQAVIHDTQTLVAGSTVKLRLLTDVYINGQLVEKDQFVFGTCAISGERLTITINSIRDEHSVLPVSLTVFDLDGMEGIYIPGAITRDAAKQASSQSIQDVQLSSMDDSLGVQAATAGIEAAKGLFSRKAKLIKVTVKAGYQVLLKDKNQSVQ